MSARFAVLIAGIIAAAVGLTLLSALIWPATATPVYWREGPITIERQLGVRPQPVAQIVYIDALGADFATRDGVMISELACPDLLMAFKDLLDYEIALSWPPEKRRKRP